MTLKKTGQRAQLAWRRASFCASGECVEVAQQDSMVILRDSTRPHGIVVRYPVEDWVAFVRDVRSGKLDGLVP